MLTDMHRPGLINTQKSKEKIVETFKIKRHNNTYYTIQIHHNNMFIVLKTLFFTHLSLISRLLSVYLRLQSNLSSIISPTSGPVGLVRWEFGGENGVVLGEIKKSENSAKKLFRGFRSR